MLYTSYFFNSNLKQHDEDSLISVCLYPPPFYKGRRWEFFYPSKELLRDYKDGKVTNKEYIEIYYEIVLNVLDPETFRSMPNDHIMLCYESPSKFCHRHIIRHWLNKNNIKCEELS